MLLVPAKQQCSNDLARWTSSVVVCEALGREGKNVERAGGQVRP
jgi:hypothetical protein